jgi:hypothetical protein
MPHKTTPVKQTRRAAMVSELHRLHQEGGGVLKARTVLSAAEDPASPLHSYFEWDDSKAAAAHRLEQAGTLIRSVTIKYTIDKTILRLPFYVPDPTRNRKLPGYTQLTTITHVDAQKALAIQEFDAVVTHLQRAGKISFIFGNPKVHKTVLRKITEMEALLDHIRGIDVVKKSIVRQATVRVLPKVAANRI